MIELSPPKKMCRKKWAGLIKNIFEVDPLCCPCCLHQMRIVLIINEPEIIEKILKHLDLEKEEPEEVKKKLKGFLDKALKDAREDNRIVDQALDGMPYFYFHAVHSLWLVTAK